MDHHLTMALSRLGRMSHGCPYLVFLDVRFRDEVGRRLRRPSWTIRMGVVHPMDSSVLPGMSASTIRARMCWRNCLLHDNF